MDSYLQLLGLVAALFFLPKSLQRVRVPAPLTEFGLGVLLGPAVAGLVEPNGLLRSLSGFGISALFLFAGLEVEFGELRSRRGPLALHLALQLGLVGVATAVGWGLGLEPAVALLIGAAVMSPSVGYIASALEARAMRPDLATWIKQKAIAGELMAIAMVLVFANTRSPRDLALGLGAVAGLVIAVPLLIWIFHHFILPWAPRTEFPFLLILALFAADLSHKVGVHYLAGAFIVGVVARRYLDGLGRRGIASASVGEALVAFRFFAAFFVPFFFFLVGLLLPPAALSSEAALLAGALLAVAVPLRVVPTLLHRRVGMRERWQEAASVGLFLVPTTVFTFAVAELLRERFDLAPWVYGGLVAYGAATALVPLLLPGGVVERGDEIVDVATEEILRDQRSEMSATMHGMDHEATRSFYDRISGVYDAIADAGEHRSRERGLELLAVRPGERVLEVGYGTGHSLLALAQSAGPGGRVAGIDISEGMRRIAEKRIVESGLGGRVELSNGAAPPLPWADATFDAAFMSFTLELFPLETIPRLLVEVRRVLRRGGRLGVVAMAETPEGERQNTLNLAYKWLHRHFPHIVDCRPIDAAGLLRRAGFEILSYESAAIFSLPVAIVVARASGPADPRRADAVQNTRGLP